MLRSYKNADTIFAIWCLHFVHSSLFSSVKSANDYTLQKHPSQVLFKIGFQKNFAKFTAKQLRLSLFCNKVVGFQPTVALKKRLRHRCFSVNLVKFLITRFS